MQLVLQIEGAHRDAEGALQIVLQVLATVTPPRRGHALLAVLTLRFVRKIVASVPSLEGDHGSRKEAGELFQLQ